MEASDRWAELVSGPEEAIPLDEAALLISAAAQPDLDVPAQLERLDRLAAEGGTGADGDGVCELLFERFGLSGDRTSYDDPENSFLDRVLDRRLGIPISLSVLLIEVGRRCGVLFEPVAMPGHFLVRQPGSAGPSYIDAFDRGRRMDEQGCERLLQSVAGPTARLDPAMLRAAPKRAVLARMLLNLDGSYERRHDHRALAWVSELRWQLPGSPLGDRVQLAGRLAALGRFDRAADLLESASESARSPDATARLASEALTLRARLN